MSGALPEGLQALLSQAPPGGAGPALPQGLQADDQDQGYSALDCLKDVIDDFPKLLTELSDPKDVETAVSALKLLASIQTRLMQGGSGAPQPGQ